MSKYSDKDIQYMLDTANSYHDDLNDWELSFIQSITKQWEKKRTLSEKQIDNLEKIHNKLP